MWWVALFVAGSLPSQALARPKLLRLEGGWVADPRATLPMGAAALYLAGAAQAGPEVQLFGRLHLPAPAAAAPAPVGPRAHLGARLWLRQGGAAAHAGPRRPILLLQVALCVTSRRPPGAWPRPAATGTGRRGLRGAGRPPPRPAAATSGGSPWLGPEVRLVGWGRPLPAAQVRAHGWIGLPAFRPAQLGPAAFGPLRGRVAVSLTFKRPRPWRPRHLGLGLHAAVPGTAALGHSGSVRLPRAFALGWTLRLQAGLVPARPLRWSSAAGAVQWRPPPWGQVQLSVAVMATFAPAWALRRLGGYARLRLGRQAVRAQLFVYLPRGAVRPAAWAFSPATSRRGRPRIGRLGGALSLAVRLPARWALSGSAGLVLRPQAGRVQAAVARGHWQVCSQLFWPATGSATRSDGVPRLTVQVTWRASPW